MLLLYGRNQHSTVRQLSYFLFFLILISWRLITLQYCSGFCHTLTWISLGYTCVPHPDPPSHLPLHPIPLGLPSAPGPSTCLMHPTWAGDLFHPRQYTCSDAVLLKHPTLAFSHRVQKSKEDLLINKKYRIERGVKNDCETVSWLGGWGGHQFGQGGQKSSGVVRTWGSILQMMSAPGPTDGTVYRTWIEISNKKMDGSPLI